MILKLIVTLKSQFNLAVKIIHYKIEFLCFHHLSDFFLLVCVVPLRDKGFPFLLALLPITSTKSQSFSNLSNTSSHLFLGRPPFLVASSDNLVVVVRVHLSLLILLTCSTKLIAFYNLEVQDEKI